MTKDYELYEPYKYWDPFVEKESDKRKEAKEN